MKPKKQPVPDENPLPSYYSALRFACGCFGVEMPQMERMLQIIRQREENPNVYFPERLNRVMLNQAERGIGSWANMDHKPLETVAIEALYDQIRRHKDGKPLFSKSGDVIERLVFALLRLYESVLPRLDTDGVAPQDCMWTLIEHVFAPTVFIHLQLNWQRGLAREFQLEDCWYLPRNVKGQRVKPFPRVLQYLFHAVDCPNSHSLGKTSTNDALRRKADRWLKEGKLPKKDQIHSFVNKFAVNAYWLEEPDDWEPRLIMACAMERLSRHMDKYFQSRKSASSLEFAQLLEQIGREDLKVDDGLELAQAQTFFAALLLQKRLHREGRWETKIMTHVRKSQNRKLPRRATYDEAEQFRHATEWGSRPGNWFLEFIIRQPASKKAARAGVSLSGLMLDMGIRELNLLLDAKRGRRAKARRPCE